MQKALNNRMVISWNFFFFSVKFFLFKLQIVELGTIFWQKTISNIYFLNFPWEWKSFLTLHGKFQFTFRIHISTRKKFKSQIWRKKWAKIWMNDSFGNSDREDKFFLSRTSHSLLFVRSPITTTRSCWLKLKENF